MEPPERKAKTRNKMRRYFWPERANTIKNSTEFTLSAVRDLLNKIYSEDSINLSDINKNYGKEAINYAKQNKLINVRGKDLAITPLGISFINSTYSIENVKKINGLSTKLNKLTVYLLLITFGILIATLFNKQIAQNIYYAWYVFVSILGMIAIIWVFYKPE
jgi:hypothetical protein